MEKHATVNRQKKNLINFRVNDQTYKKLQEKADALECSVSEVIRDVIKNFLTEK